MATVPQEILDALNDAETKNQAAHDADDAHATTQADLVTATQSEANAAAASLQAHRDAVDAGQHVIDLVKKEFGLA